MIVTGLQNKARANEQALTQYRQYLDKQITIVQQTYDIIGRSVFNAQALISLTQPRFDPTNFRSEDQQVVSAQKAAIINDFNQFLLEWQKEKTKTGPLLSFYFFGQADVLPAWKSLQGSVDKLLACASTTYLNYLNDPSYRPPQSNVCQGDLTDINDKLDALSIILDKNRSFSWQQIEIPGK
jgi:hypothetical protein